MNTIRDDRDTDDLRLLDTHMGDECPTMEVEVPQFRPRPVDGYAFIAHAPRETDIDDIDNEEWDTEMVVGSASDTYVFLGQRVIDDTTCNVWWMEEEDAFLAQTLVLS